MERATDEMARGLLRDGVAFHTHVGWVKPAGEDCRAILDPLTAVKSAAAAGMAAIVLRDCTTNTAGIAAVLQGLVSEIRVLGGLFLNAEVGGINPFAVETAMTWGNGARFVCLATNNSANLARRVGIDEATIAGDPVRYVTPFVDGRLTGAMYRVLEIVAERDVLLETGDLSAEEILLFLQEANRVGVRRKLVTHPSPRHIGMSVDDQLRAVELGAKIEYAWMFYTHHSALVARRYPSRYAVGTAEDIGIAYDQICTVGPDNVVLSTDFGQLDLPLPEEGLREFIFSLLELGMRDDQISKMVRDNPAALLGLRLPQR